MATSGSNPHDPQALSPQGTEPSGLLPALEALLFAAPMPLTLEALAEALEPLPAAEIPGMLDQLRAELEGAGRGVTLVAVAGGWQIVSRPEYAPYVQRMLRGRRKARLSRAALETLAIVAYRQPVTKADIEGIRGVDSSGVLAHLLERNLVGIRGRAHTVGRPLLYGTTQEFLVYFGINDLTDLPKPEELAELLKDREGLEVGLFDAIEGDASEGGPQRSAGLDESPSGDAEGMSASDLDELEAAWEEPTGAPGGGSDGDEAR